MNYRRRELGHDGGGGPDGGGGGGGGGDGVPAAAAGIDPPQPIVPGGVRAGADLPTSVQIQLKTAPSKIGVGKPQAINMDTYDEIMDLAKDTGNVLPTSVAGEGPKAGGLIPVMQPQAARFFFRAHDYIALGKYYKNGKLQMEEVGDMGNVQKAKQMVNSTIQTFGTTLGISKPAYPNSKDPKAIVMEALECEQYMKALLVYQKETQGLYQAENTVTSAVDSAVDAILNGTTPGLYPFMSGDKHQESGLWKHAKQPNQAQRPSIMGEFKMPLKKRQKIKPFTPINYA